MNLRWESFLLAGLIIFSFLSGCIKDDSEDCGNQGITISFYSKTPCQTDSIYPADIKEIILSIFDRNDLLVQSIKLTNVELNKDYSYNIEIDSSTYSIIAWSGISEENYTITDLQNGITTKSDLLFRLKRTQNQANSIEGTRVFFGESPDIYVPENNKSGTVFQKTAINMLEITNRITISLSGILDNDEYEISIESNNGSMNIDGTIATDDLITYAVNYVDNDSILEAHFTVLKLDTEQTNTIIITDKTSDTEIYRENLLETLLLKNPYVNLNCDHDFVINFTTGKDNEGTVILEIWVNNWLVHSYETDL
ncbi:MAG: FimB/Mfa2 family fimbrial subunit [Odoribacter sp.]|nr:FimB/Mfa2 family fimbrial subunit [Odoribacter sp.]